MVVQGGGTTTVLRTAMCATVVEVSRMCALHDSSGELMPSINFKRGPGWKKRKVEAHDGNYMGSRA